MLPDFEIQNFRTFSRLHVGRLGRVNLIVGRNNVGKTMFLEALRLYVLGGHPFALRNLLLDRDEVQVHLTSPAAEATTPVVRIATLFHLPTPRSGTRAELRLGPTVHPANVLEMKLQMIRRVQAEPGLTPRFEVADGPQSNDLSEQGLGLVISQGTNREAFPLDPFFGTDRMWAWRSSYQSANLMWPAFVPARGISDREIGRWWDAVALRDGEKRVLECLRLVAPVERITLVEHPAKSGDRLVLAKVSDNGPVPLKSLGDGMARMFQIALALECSREGWSERRNGADARPFPAPSAASDSGNALLLVDEIENGIHYTVLPELWDFLIRVAERNDVQVFATSHSWDCVVGLQEAAAKNPQADVMLIRLERRDDKTKAVLFDRNELAIVARDEIEVR